MTLKASALLQHSESLHSWSQKGQPWVAVRGAEGALVRGLPLHLFSEELVWAAARNTLWLIGGFEMATKGGRKEFLYWFAESVPKELFLFFFLFLPKAMSFWQFSSPGPELNISIFGQRHRTKFSLPRWINGTLPDSQCPVSPLRSHESSEGIQRESMLNFVSVTHLFVSIVFFFFVTTWYVSLTNTLICFLDFK